LRQKLRFYDGVAHRGVFGLGKHIREGIAAEERVITKATPVYMN